MSSEMEQKLLELLDDTVAQAPSTVFIDKTDAVTPKRESLANSGGKPVLIIGATTRPDALDSTLHADFVSLTKEAAVIAVNCLFSTRLAMSPEPVTATESVVCERRERDKDDESETRTATAAAVDAGSQVSSAAVTIDSIRSRKTPFASAPLTLLSITMADVVAAVNKVRRSAKCEGISTTPDVT
ncbi:hypothetical protein PybrP1_006457 [[Pythium] brassicae (nom. inval.)]|nr:hypothetical protein PybrP1_006457 [[Pythium] brassicae (nom. inval.)]